MKFPWFWITGIAATTIVVGAISTGLIHPHMPPRPEGPSPIGTTSFKEDPWEVFIRTEGMYITDQIEQLGMKIERLEINLANVNRRIAPRLKDSPEMREARQHLNSMRASLQQLKDRRQRLYLRWNLGQEGPWPRERTPEGNKEDERNDESVPLPGPGISPLKPRWDGEIPEQHRPPIQKLIEIQGEVIREELKEQGHFQRLFGQNFVESQMARYAFIYKHFEAQGVRNQASLLRLTRCYSDFIRGGVKFDANPQMMPQVHHFCPKPPNPQLLEGIQKTIAEDVQVEKVFFGGRFEMEVTRYSKERLRKIYDYAKNTGATDDQARALAINLKDFINNGALPSNK